MEDGCSATRSPAPTSSASASARARRRAIAIVAFLSGPIAARTTGTGGSLPVPAGLVADFTGRYAFGTRFPVGVVTGVLGAPYRVHPIVRTNRAGGSL